ncbi:acidic leucine-rich nuclear phosphoprotein 32 family member A [Nilaparvata lugens]|uniref:acidic leucine-rich nuclear phosphoprotein 32 family member A n=1 Tax=Nilaparvata lugens TaxID=108931 RepID=UPI000B98D382|nr:acidic leucine-rich nuclear phosphoprotein 32 family member A [Nilaparvata lugens]
MEKRIELEKRGRNPAEIEELNLDNCRSTNIVGLTDEFKNLKVLSLINVGLTSLKGFPTLPNLRKLELSDNRISNCLTVLHTSPKLTYLNLSGNKLTTLEAIEPLVELKALKSLDLFNNEITANENYREKVFKMLPSLKCLDGYDANDKEVEDDSDDDEEVNGNDDTDDEEGDFEEGDTEEIGLMTVYDDNLEEESEGDDFEVNGSEDDLDDEDEDEEDDDGTIDDDDDDEDDHADDGDEPSPKKRKQDGGQNSAV